MVEVRVPELSPGVMGATISMWHFTEGDLIKKGEDLVELVTDKATFNLPAPAEGKIKELMSREGEMVKTDDLIAIIE